MWDETVMDGLEARRAEVVAGLELNARIAERVFDMELDREGAFHLGAPLEYVLRNGEGAVYYRGRIPSYSTDHNVAAKVVEAFQEQGWTLLHFAWSPHPDRPGKHTARFLAAGVEQAESHAETMPLAVCQAALAALEAYQRAQ